MISIKTSTPPHRKGYYIAFAFAISYSLLSAKNMLIESSAAFYNRNSTLNLFVAVVSVAIYVYVILFKEKHLPIFRKQMLVLILVLFLWFFTYLINSSLFTYSYVREELSEFIIYSLPALLFLPMLYDCDELIVAFYKCRWLMFLAVCVSVILMMIYGRIQGSGTRYLVYSMSFGRALMLPCTLFISKWFRDHKIIDMLGSISCVLFILVFGSRFPLLCIGFYTLCKAFQIPFSKARFVGLSICIISAVLLFLNKDFIVNTLYSYFVKAGINSRSLSLLTNGSFSYDSGRLRIITQLVGEINKSPIIGYGAGGGNVALNNGLSHSFIFDVFANLGYVGGGIFLLISFIAIFQLYRHTKKWSNKEFMMICISFFVPICIFQMSLWRASYFWMLIALCCGRLQFYGGNEDV
jgi:hypothetical protein